jgi:hypothetical protein
MSMDNSIVLFTQEQGNLLIRILLAHLLSDFVFQSKKMFENKKWISLQMLLHVAIVFSTTFILTQWLVGAAIIALFHYLIDSVKFSVNKNARYSGTTIFIVDQLLHFVSIILVWATYSSVLSKLKEAVFLPFNNYKLSVLFLAYLMVTTPLSYLIKNATQNIRKGRTLANDGEEAKTENGGKLIGIFERIIILTFVLLGQYEAIGFLITGKSIIRFANNKEHIESEYVLVGTMMSYAIAILIGVFANFLISMN